MRLVGMPAQQRQHRQEANNVDDSDVPAAPDPRANRARFRIEIRNGDTGGRAEPDHRTAIAHCEGQHAPVVTALFECELRQHVRDNGGDENCHDRRSTSSSSWYRRPRFLNRRRWTVQRETRAYGDETPRRPINVSANTMKSIGTAPIIENG